jgi:methionyl-tRNA formyltransferase
LPQALLDLFPHGCLNIHGSVLPTLRGPSPIQTAILQGLPESGVTIMVLDEGMDTGPILSTATTPLSPTETSQTLHDRLKIIGAELLIKILPDYLSGNIKPQPQDDSRASLCHLIEKTDGLIDWSQPAQQIDRHIRALNPWPGTYTVVDDLRIKILAAHLEDGRLVIDRLQPAGKQPMSWEEFKRGYPQLQI